MGGTALLARWCALEVMTILVLATDFAATASAVVSLDSWVRRASYSVLDPVAVRVTVMGHAALMGVVLVTVTR